jgi:hypothetical protein
MVSILKGVTLENQLIVRNGIKANQQMVRYIRHISYLDY